MTGVRLRPATPADTGAVDTLLQRSYPRLLKADYPPSVLVTALPKMVKAQPALLRSGTYYVAEDETGALLGAGGWTARIPGVGKGRESGRANVRHVVTDPDATRRGVGRAIMTHAMTQAKAAGMTWIHCMATRTAVPFYEAVGFERLGDVNVELGPGISLSGS